MSREFWFGTIVGTISGIIGTVVASLIQSGLSHYRDKVRLKPTLKWVMNAAGVYVSLFLACTSHRKARIRSVYVQVKVLKMAADDTKSKEKVAEVDSPTVNLPFNPIDAPDNIEMERDQSTEYQLMFNDKLYGLIADSKPKNVSLQAELMNGTIIQLGKGKGIQSVFKRAVLFYRGQDNSTDTMN